MRQVSRLRPLRNLANTEDADPKPQGTNHDSARFSPRTTVSGKVNNSSGGGRAAVEVPSGPSNNVRTAKPSLFLGHKNEEDERGCMEAVSAFLAAIATTCQDSKGAVGAPVATERQASPALLQTSKGAGTIECQDSARKLLRFFGHAPLLHLEGVIWVKTCGERGDETWDTVINSSAPGYLLMYQKIIIIVQRRGTVCTSCVVVRTPHRAFFHLCSLCGDAHVPPDKGWFVGFVLFG